MLPSPGWFVFTAFLLLEVLLVLVLILPMPSNSIRGAVLDGTLKLWRKKAVQYAFWGMAVFSAIYFWDSLTTIFWTPVYAITCEQQLLLFFTERNAYATGFSLLLFLVIRRILDIQTQLFVARTQVKAADSKSQ